MSGPVEPAIEACPLCAAAESTVVRGAYSACSSCGLVFNRYPFDRVETRPADGWLQRASHLGPEIPKTALASCTVEQLAEALALGTVYIETPNTREPKLSLRRFFAAGHPVYFEPQTLALMCIVAGADDMVINEAGGMICALVVPGGKRCGYAEAVERGGFTERIADVPARMAACFEPRPIEALGDVVVGACFVCGGERRTWRSVHMCVSCSALTVPTFAADPITELHARFVPYEDQRFMAPNPRTLSADDAEAACLTRSVVLDEHGWAAVLLMAGADMAKCNRVLGVLDIAGISMGTPRRKTYAEACDVLNAPRWEARHLIGVWNQGEERETAFEAWLAGDDADPDAMRVEAARTLDTANAAVVALDTITTALAAEQDNPDDWHEDPYLCGVRMGRASAFLQAQTMVHEAYMALVRRVST